MGERRRLLRWGSWFALVHAGLLALVGLRYLWYYVTLVPSVAWVYATLAFVGQMSALAYIPFLLLVPLIVLIPRPRLIVPLGVLMGSAVLSFLVLDSLLFADNRYHLSVLTLTLLAPHTWAFLALYFLMGLAIEAMLAGWVWRRTTDPPRHRLGRYVALGIVGCFLASHLIHMFAEAHYYVPVTSFTRYLSLYFPLKDSRRLARLGLVDQARVGERDLVAFDMLAENFTLHGVSFLWIRDLSRPDELLRLPACLPFFGCYLNLLPFLMSSISIAALLRFHSPVLTPGLVRRQRRNLTGMALLFFLLFYTFPASMVLYWTSTNFAQLIGQEVGRLRRRLA